MSEHTKGELKTLITSGELPAILDDYEIVIGYMVANDPQDIANAHRLVKCWNCHDDLLAACKDFVNLAALGMAINILSDEENFKKKEIASLAQGMAIVLKGLEGQAKAALAKATKE